MKRVLVAGIIAALFISLSSRTGTASGGGVSIDQVKVASCLPGSLSLVTATIRVDSGTHLLYRQLVNTRTGAMTASGSAWTRGSGTFDIEIAVPDATQHGDILALTLAVTSANGGVYGASYFAYDCAVGGAPLPPAASPETTPSDAGSTDPLGLIDPLLSLPDARGIRPCGVFDVQGWGPKSIALGGFPACAAASAPAVACLNDRAQWTAEHIDKMVYDAAAWTVKFESRQHGTCGIFLP